MANRFFNQFSGTLEKGVIVLSPKISFGASGAPTLSTSHGKGVSTVSRTSTGLYVLTLQDTYVALLGFVGSYDATGSSGAAPLAPIVFCKTNAVTTPATGGTITFVTGDYVNGAVADPASGEILMLTIVLSNSTAF